MSFAAREKGRQRGKRAFEMTLLSLLNDQHLRAANLGSKRRKIRFLSRSGAFCSLPVSMLSTECTRFREAPIACRNLVDLRRDHDRAKARADSSMSFVLSIGRT